MFVTRTERPGGIARFLEEIAVRIDRVGARLQARTVVIAGGEGVGGGGRRQEWRGGCR